MKTRQISWLLTIVVLASFGFGACKCKRKQPPPKQVPPPQVQQLPEPEGKAWVEKKIAEYPELLWLAQANVRKTEEGQAAADKPYSEQLFGQKYIEFDRSVMSLYCLKLILDGSDKAYQEFTAAQQEAVRLSRESFRTLHEQGQGLLKSNYGRMTPQEMQRALETALVLGDMGKSEAARALFAGITVPDHDDFYGEAMGQLQRKPMLCPSFARLSFRSKQLLCKVANVAHYGHITHLEGGPAMFAKLKQSRIAVSDPAALSFDLFVHTCDVAGALGHMNHQSSLVYIAPTHQGMQGMAEACRALADPAKTEADAYDAYLEKRAAWLGLNPQNRDDRVLARIGAMLRLYSLEEGADLKNAMLQLSGQDRTRIAAQLDVREGPQLERTPTYMPAVLVNLFNNKSLGDTPQARLAQAVVRGLPFIARVLERHQEQLVQHKANPQVPLNFNNAAGIAKTAPDFLSQKDVTIDENGNVMLAP